MITFIGVLAHIIHYGAYLAIVVSLIFGEGYLRFLLIIFIMLLSNAKFTLYLYNALLEEAKEAKIVEDIMKYQKLLSTSYLFYIAYLIFVYSATIYYMRFASQ